MKSLLTHASLSFSFLFLVKFLLSIALDCVATLYIGRGDLFNKMTATNPDNVMAMDTVHNGDDEPPPGGGYGWVCVAACFMINFFTWGIISVS